MFKYWCRVSVSLLVLCINLTKGMSSELKDLDYDQAPLSRYTYYNHDNSMEDKFKKDFAQMLAVFENIIDSKMSAKNNNIVRELKEYIDNKMEMNHKKISEKLDENIVKNSDLKSDCNNNFNLMYKKIKELENATSVNCSELTNTVLLGNDKLMNMTSKLYDGIDKTRCKTTVTLKTLEDSLNEAKTNELNNKATAGLLQINESITNNKITKIRWNECQIEVVKNIYGVYNYSKPLRPLADAALQYASFRAGGVRTSYLQMRFGALADQYAALVLSPERDPKDQGFAFKIDFWTREVKLQAIDAAHYTKLEHIYKNTYLSQTHRMLVYIQISNDTLEIRLNSHDGEPILTHHDYRFSSLKYYGFDTYLNDMGYARFFYDC